VEQEARQLGVATLVQMVTSGELTFAGDAGGAPWTVRQRASLFVSIESGLPAGQLVAWAPSWADGQRWHLFDGHRRLRTLMEMVIPVADPLVRDLSIADPAYLAIAAAEPGGDYLPCSAVLDMLSFEAASRPLPSRAARLCAHVAASFAAARFDVVTLLGGSVLDAKYACDRLVPGRVKPPETFIVPIRRAGR
jgi:hypothetical protein